MANKDLIDLVWDVEATTLEEATSASERYQHPAGDNLLILVSNSDQVGQSGNNITLLRKIVKGAQSP
jgi:hypothetical protein